MMMFIYGFSSALLLFFIIYLIVSAGVNLAVKDHKIAIAIYNNKEKKWKTTKGFDKIAELIAFRRKHYTHMVEEYK
jgi:hypothetical protein